MILCIVLHTGLSPVQNCSGVKNQVITDPRSRGALKRPDVNFISVHAYHVLPPRNDVLLQEASLGDGFPDRSRRNFHHTPPYRPSGTVDF